MLPIHSSTRFCLLLSITCLLLQSTQAGIGLKPLDFFRFSEEELGKEVKVIFHPDEGLRLRDNFQKKYGTKGEELIKSLGEGLIFVTNSVKPDS